MIIRDTEYTSGCMIKCTFSNGDVIDGALCISYGRLWICHDSNVRQGHSAPELYGFRHSWVFQYLNERFTEDVTDIDYLGEGYKNSSFSVDMSRFLQLSKIGGTLRTLMSFKVKPYEAYNSYDISEKPGYILMSGEVKTPNGNKVKVIEIKFSRYISRIISSEYVSEIYKNIDIENIHNSLVAYQTGDALKISILSGKDILNGYSSKSYSTSATGTLHKSCMNDKLSYLDIYTKNKQVKLACLSSDKGIEARCLIWEADDKIYFDRIYYTLSWAASIIEEKLKKLGYINLATYFESRSEYSINIKLDTTIMDKFPYLDSFRYLSQEKGRLYFLNDNYSDRRLPADSYFKLTSTSGTYELLEIE